MRAYGQYCPVARTAELFAERWTPIIVRNLLNGCRTFTEIRQGAPGIPTALLAQRLDTLERAGIVARQPGPGRGVSYDLTDKGRELKAVCDAMGQWGARWLEVEPQHMDPAYVLWATTKLVDVEKLPDRPVVVRFEMVDRPADNYWLLLQQAAAGALHQRQWVRRGHRRPYRLRLPDRHPPQAHDVPARTPLGSPCLGRRTETDPRAHDLDPTEPVRRRCARRINGARCGWVRVGSFWSPARRWSANPRSWWAPAKSVRSQTDAAFASAMTQAHRLATSPQWSPPVPVVVYL
jgi:DNA-binding HxlR family transcriptional regulator